MKINGFKVLDTFTFDDCKTGHTDTVYVLQRKPAYYYIEIDTGDDERVGIFLDRMVEDGIVKCNLLGFVWVMDCKFDEDVVQQILRKALLDVPMESYKYHLAKCDLLLLKWYDYYAELHHNLMDDEHPSFVITSISDDGILFSNGKMLTCSHVQDCCEFNYADFCAVDDTVLDYRLHEPLVWELVEEYGFRFGNDGCMIGVPCFSEQNGYYGDDVDIYYDGTCVLNAYGVLMGC